MRSSVRFALIWLVLSSVGCSDDSTNGVSCDDLFGTAPNYTLCETRDASCVFWYQTPGRATEVTCDELCGSAVCLTAYDDDMQMPCTMGLQIPCDDDAADGVCECGLSL